MNYLNERVSYLRGLAEGMGIKDDTKEGKLLVNIVDLLDDIVDAISELEVSQAELDDYIETIDGDLSELEEELFGEDEDDDEESRYIEVECPNCHDTVFLDEEIFNTEDEIICPNCHEPVYTDIDEDEMEEVSDTE
ncbi:MAG: CD1247 N-terminal domain-containing protein [Clostridia bacterium]